MPVQGDGNRLASRASRVAGSFFRRAAQPVQTCVGRAAGAADFHREPAVVHVHFHGLPSNSAWWCVVSAKDCLALDDHILSELIVSGGACQETVPGVHGSGSAASAIPSPSASSGDFRGGNRIG